MSHYSYFFILNCPIKPSIFLFLLVNQLTIAKMNSFSLLRNFERIPELRFKYMRSYPSDKVPQLTKYAFAIIDSVPRNDRGEHWIMIARMDKTYYFADSMGRKRSTYSLQIKKYRRTVHRKLQKTDDLWGFYAIYSAFLLFKFFQKNLNNIYVVHVLSFIRNLMSICIFSDMQKCQLLQ